MFLEVFYFILWLSYDFCIYRVYFLFFSFENGLDSFCFVISMFVCMVIIYFMFFKIVFMFYILCYYKIRYKE